MRTDPIAEMFCALKNAYLRKRVSCNIQSSNLKLKIARILKTIGLIDRFRENGSPLGKRFLYITLAYANSDEGGFFKKKSKFSGWKRISSPGKRVYMKKKDYLHHFHFKKGFLIISTSDPQYPLLYVSLITLRWRHRELNLPGGEVLVHVW